MTDDYPQDSLFSIFMMQQQHLAWLYLGKMANPATGSTERNLDAARFTIDLLGMIETKTSGNLTADEEKLLGQVLTALRLNYMEEARRGGSDEPAHGPDAATDTGPETKPETGPDAKPG